MGLRIMRYDNGEMFPILQKIHHKQKRNRNYLEEKYGHFTDEQQPGSIHLVSNELVFPNAQAGITDYEKNRPGAVLVPPSCQTNYETEWIPFTSKISNRNEKEVVFLQKGIDSVDKDSVALLIERRWFKCPTLGPRHGRLPNNKVLEIEDKIRELCNDAK